MTTFAEEVYLQVFSAAEGSTRMLDDFEYTKLGLGGYDEMRWIAATGRHLSDLQMYEATINAD